jgi:predicted aspartyl protease
MDSVAAIGKITARHAIVAALALMLPAIAPGFVGTLADPASPTSLPMPTLPMENPPDSAAAKADYEASTRHDYIGRVIVPVLVNDQGPFLFALDTGANRTVISPRLVELLGLHAAGDPVTMHGATGSAAVPTVFVERIAAGDIVLEKQQLPVADPMTSGIDGILGVDGLESKRIVVDFTNRRIDIRNANRRSPHRAAMAIPAQVRFGRLVEVDAYIEGRRVKAVIDTGSQYTLGNSALYAALFRSGDAKVPNPTIDVLGTTLAWQQGVRQPVAALNIGEVRVSRFNVVFGDFYIFTLWNLDTQPALVIGMDLIGRLDALVIDYQRQEVQMQVRGQREERYSLQ